TLKIAHLGRQIRDTNHIFSALKENVEQVMATLQDGLIFFTQDLRVVLVSASAERFLGRPRREILGHTAKELFSETSPLGALVIEAFERRRPLVQREMEGEKGRRVQVSLDFIQEKGSHIGALLTMRDAESVRRIEDEIEMSRRLSASSRLTRGVAHEVKNPINAIVLHLQLLQNKLQQIDPDTRRHMEIIGNEIHRLDRVVTEIRDQGGGIPPEIQDKIFELYFTTKKEGSGIGLAQTYQIMQWHYGSVDFESRDGKGTTFRLQLPLAESPLDALRELATRD